MKKKILIADKDASLKEAFRIIFSEDRYDILYAPSAKEVERLVAADRPDIYIVNVSLSKSSGIDVYKKLQKDRFLDSARFFFMKDENDSTELLGFQAEGVIEKPINFFKVHERIAKDDDLVVLTDEVEEPETHAAPRPEPQTMRPEPHEAPRLEPHAAPRPEPKTAPRPELQTAWQAAVRTSESASLESATKEAPVRQDIDLKVEIEGLTRGLEGRTAESIEGMAPALEAELHKVLNLTVEEVVPRFVERMSSVLSTFVEDYTRRVLYEIAEKIIREEIDKLLKESAS